MTTLHERSERVERWRREDQQRERRDRRERAIWRWIFLAIGAASALAWGRSWAHLEVCPHGPVRYFFEAAGFVLLFGLSVHCLARGLKVDPTTN